MHAQGGRAPDPTPSDIWHRNAQSTKCYQFQLRLSLLATWQRSFSNAESSVVVCRPSGVNVSLKSY